MISEKMKILIVDDRHENLEVLKTIITRSDIQIFSALSGEEALSLVLDHDFALILMDVQMPGMDGFETAGLIRGDSGGNQTPIIFITAISKDLQHVFKGYESGGVDYLFKPFEPEILRSKVDVFLELHRNKISLENANRELDQARLAAFEASRLKSEFLANMSHEIRTPMNGIIGMTGLLIDTDLEPRQLEFAEIIKNCGDTLLVLIDDILDFSKIEAGRLDLEIINFNLRTSCEDAFELLAVRAQEKGLEYVCIIAPEVNCLLKGDPGRLRQVIINLTGNAVKFTATGGITVRVGVIDESDDWQILRFEVVDTGIGIPTKILPTLFAPFIQADGSTTRKFGGTGLGLSICKELIELMDGDIGVESVEGDGATFWFSVKLSTQPLSDQDKRSFDYDNDLTGQKILVVDGDQTNRESLKLILADWGCSVIDVSDGQIALDVLRHAVEFGVPFDAAIVDMHMPTIGGESFGEEINADQHIRATKLIMVTSLGRRGDATRLAQIGFDAYLTKPIKRSTLGKCLVSLLLEEEPAKEGVPNNIITRHSLAEEQLSRVRILLAEDDEINQMVAQGILEKWGIGVEVVANGQEVLEALAHSSYDLILMDCQMPVMNG